MHALSFEQIKELIEFATARGPFDYLSMALPIVAVL